MVNVCVLFFSPLFFSLRGVLAWKHGCGGIGLPLSVIPLQPPRLIEVMHGQPAASDPIPASVTMEHLYRFMVRNEWQPTDIAASVASVTREQKFSVTLRSCGQLAASAATPVSPTWEQYSKDADDNPRQPAPSEASAWTRERGWDGRGGDGDGGTVEGRDGPR